jgi:GNAT superfamily N-acetyltransferase
MSRVDRAENGTWAANRAGQIAGTIVIDGGDLGRHPAHLRWFIVDETARSAGIGRRLLTEVVSFCDRKGSPEIELWTFAGLDAAKHLYESVRLHGCRGTTRYPMGHRGHGATIRSKAATKFNHMPNQERSSAINA